MPSLRVSIFILYCFVLHVAVIVHGGSETFGVMYHVKDSNKNFTFTYEWMAISISFPSLIFETNFTLGKMEKLSDRGGLSTRYVILNGFLMNGENTNGSNILSEWKFYYDNSIMLNDVDGHNAEVDGFLCGKRSTTMPQNYEIFHPQVQEYRTLQCSFSGTQFEVVVIGKLKMGEVEEIIGRKQMGGYISPGFFILFKIKVRKGMYLMISASRAMGPIDIYVKASDIPTQYIYDYSQTVEKYTTSKYYKNVVNETVEFFVRLEGDAKYDLTLEEVASNTYKTNWTFSLILLCVIAVWGLP